MNAFVTHVLEKVVVCRRKHPNQESLTMKRMTILTALSALTLANGAIAQSGPKIHTQPKLTAPSGDVFFSRIVIDRETGGLKLCGSVQFQPDVPVTCGPMPDQTAQEDTAPDTPVPGLTPKAQSLWKISA